MLKASANSILPILATRDFDEIRWIAETLKELMTCDLAQVRPTELQVSAFKHPSWGRSDHFLRFVQHCTSLKILVLGYTANLLVSEEVFSYLAGLRSISMIKIYRFLDEAFIHSVLRLMPSRPLFPAVRDMTFCVKAQAFALLAPSMIAVRRLTLWVEDSNNEICGLVGQLPCLTQLILKFLTAKEFSRNELASLAKLQNLHDLRLEVSEDISGSHLAVPWMKDFDFEEWICSFPHLRILCLDWSSGDTLLTAGATASLARRCPELISVVVLWHHNLNVWMASSPLVKNLKIISFKSISISQDNNNHDELLTNTE
ncbi:hypothetical protein KCU77_g4142, partial [Aureobasidium melanogenum]